MPVSAFTLNAHSDEEILMRTHTSYAIDINATPHATSADWATSYLYQDAEDIGSALRHACLGLVVLFALFGTPTFTSNIETPIGTTNAYPYTPENGAYELGINDN
jgi:hypothetical protein